MLTDWPPELREKAREAFWERKDADPDERLLDALAAIADDIVLKRDLHRPCHFRAFGTVPCEKEEGHDGDHICRVWGP